MINLLHYCFMRGDIITDDFICAWDKQNFIILNLTNKDVSLS